jgi:hypothetical protein
MQEETRETCKDFVVCDTRPRRAEVGFTSEAEVAPCAVSASLWAQHGASFVAGTSWNWYTYCHEARCRMSTVTCVKSASALKDCFCGQNPFLKPSSSPTPMISASADSRSAKRKCHACVFLPLLAGMHSHSGCLLHHSLARRAQPCAATGTTKGVAALHVATSSAVQ